MIVFIGFVFTEPSSKKGKTIYFFIAMIAAPFSNFLTIILAANAPNFNFTNSRFFFPWVFSTLMQKWYISKTHGIFFKAVFEAQIETKTVHNKPYFERSFKFVFSLFFYPVTFYDPRLLLFSSINHDLQLLFLQYLHDPSSHIAAKSKSEPSSTMSPLIFPMQDVE